MVSWLVPGFLASQALALAVALALAWALAVAVALALAWLPGWPKGMGKSFKGQGQSGPYYGSAWQGSWPTAGSSLTGAMGSQDNPGARGDVGPRSGRSPGH